MRYGFNIQPGCSDNSLLPPKGEGLAYARVTAASCFGHLAQKKTRKRAIFPCSHPSTREEGGDERQKGGDTSKKRLVELCWPK